MLEPNRQRNLEVNVMVVKPLLRTLVGILFLGLLMVPIIAAQSGTMETDLEYGAIDWSTGVVRAKGLGIPPKNVDNATQGRAMAKRAARIVAYERLLEVTQGIKIDSRTFVKNLMVESEDISAEVKGIVKGAQVIQEQENPDGSVEVTVEMNLKKVGQAIPKGEPLPRPNVGKPKGGGEPKLQGTNYTGLVIDAQGLKVRECLAPKIKMEDGQIVYARDLWPESKVGVVGYVKGIDKASEHAKVKSNPLVVKAIRVDNGSETDLVINEADAQSIYLEPKNEKLLQEGKVVIAR